MRIKETLALFGALALSGCGTTSASSPATDIATLQSDVQTIASGLAGVLPSLCPATGPTVLTAAQCARVSADLQTVQADASKLGGFSNLASATSTAQTITTTVQDILAAAAQFPIPAPYNLAITAAQVLLPVIEQEAGIPTPAAAGVQPMSPDAARAYLRASALHAFEVHTGP